MARLVRVGGGSVTFDPPAEWGLNTGGAEYETRARPKRKPAVVFTGKTLVTATFEIVVGDGTSVVESDWWRLHHDFREPEALLRVVSQSWPYPDRRFVLTDVTRGDLEPLHPRDVAQAWRRTRFSAVVTLLEHVDADITVRRRERDRPGRQRTYTVKAGDTLLSIAARELGSATRYTELAALNDIRDPRRLRPGQVLRLPER